MSLRAFLLSFSTCAAAAVAADVRTVSDQTLEQTFAGRVQPFLETYCLSCHGAEKKEAELDLSPFKSVGTVVNGFGYWDLVLERLESAEMPPEKAKQHPTDAHREEIIAWIRALRKHEAEKSAGDPGPVLARRLSNAEYDYTIRDLTGADIRPTKEFPVDPANQAGFANSGESLTMSPALVKKYLAAARTVAEHLLLTSDGMEFAPHPVVADTDRDKYFVLKIVDFYRRQPTDLAAYFEAAWRHQHRAALGRPRATIAETAVEAKVSAKYLEMITALLTDAADDAGPIAKLRALWREFPAPNTPNAGADAHSRAVALRDYVLGLREKLVPEVKNLDAGKTGIQNGSQTLVMWKNREMSANRRRYDPAALHVEGTEVAPASPPAPAMASAAKAAPEASKNESKSGATGVLDELANVTAPASVPARTEAGGMPAQPRPAAPARTENVAGNPDVIRNGGKFLAPAVVTTGSSATFKMAAAKKRGTDPDLQVPADPAERAKHEKAFARFASVFPDAFYITERARVYLDAEKEQKLAGRLLNAGVHSMTGFYRDDAPLCDLVLDEQGRRELDRFWREFFASASVPQRMHTSFVWFERTDSNYMRDSEFDLYRPENKAVTEQPRIKKLAELYLAKATRLGASEKVQQAITDHFDRLAAAVREVEEDRVAGEPHHLRALMDFAERAYRRPITAGEKIALEKFYRASREENGVDHEEAMRDCIVAVLMSPNFCYRIDLVEAAGALGGARTSAAGASMRPVSTNAAPAMARADRAPLSDYALASRLSYFLWSSLPDAELLAHAKAGDLRKPEVLRAQVRRMLKDARVRNFAAEFAGHWLDFRRFEEHNAVDRERFPAFDNALREAMFEEPLRFLVDLVQNDRPVLDCLYGDYTFVNAPLAKHYGMPEPRAGGDGWARVDGAAKFERGGLLPMAVFLTANSPGLRTSPVKRGYWVVRRVLGERIPPPPAVVPDLPNDEKNLGDLTLREVLAKHREDKSCAACHARFDSFGLVFENFGPVGERRTKDFGGHLVDTRADFPGGNSGTGVTGLRDYIRAHREKDFVDNLCRKLVAYGLGRTLLMSDDALVAEMKAKLAANQNRFDVLVETIVTSPQFLSKRVSPDAPKTAAISP